MPRTVVGLDIGSSAVRAVELTVGARTASLRHAGQVPLPAGAVETGSVRNAAAVTQAVRELWRTARIKNRSVRLGVGSGSVLVRQLELDWMPPADLRKALRYQVADLLPVSVDDANIDHIPLGEFERTDPEGGEPRRMVRILLVATARGAVDEMVRCVHAAGLRPTTADLSALALARASARATTLRKEEPRPEAVIDIGADKVAVAVHTGGHPHFVRVVAGVGGSMLTRSLADQTGRSPEDAETLKRESQLVLEPAHQLVGELRSTLDFHAGTDPEHLPTRVLLTGGGSALAGLPELCRRALDLPVHRFEPRDVLPGLVRRPGRGKREHEDPLATDASLLVPIGLALGAAS